MIYFHSAGRKDEFEAQSQSPVSGTKIQGTVE